jgi:antitoxin HicB
MLGYPVVLERDDNGTVLVSFPDLPEAHTFGKTKADALARAADAALTAIEARMADREPIPDPSPVRVGQPVVTLSALVEAKIALYRHARQARVNKSTLARMLDVHPPQVDRLFDLHHHSRFDQIESAFDALGYRCSLLIENTRSSAGYGARRVSVKGRASKSPPVRQHR